MNLLGMEALVFGSVAFFALLLALVAIGAFTAYRNRQGPTLVALSAADHTLAVRRKEVEDAETRLRELRPLLVDADKKSAEVAWLEQRRSELATCIAKLEARIIEIGGTGADDSDADKLEDLRKMPAALGYLERAADVSIPNDDRSESAYLHRAADWIRDAGLNYPPRTLRALHTSFKIAQEAPITVLSGISGTGKTQLPRAYAQAMGMGFLPVPVQPRWDSPQDLLGFYNFIEKRFKATDLARAMWRLDIWRERASASKDDPIFDDRMLLVLLDEMNLARVEYYFSEFLSRLELRPRPSETANPDRRLGAEIVIDIPGAEPLRMFPGHNLLFVGTMNEDETTQALSDKVLDRGAMLRFPAPLKLAEAPAAGQPPLVAPLSRRVWEGWRREPAAMGEADRSRAKRIVDDLSKTMKDLGRPFGHRVGQAMLAYAANYPDAGDRPVSTLSMAMADQVEMRLLPKLRGLELDQAAADMDRLALYVREELQDDRLAEAIDASVADSADASGRFAWSGLAR
ncbi:MAG: hypothetical protein VYD87_17640 [Pseudomonadota bacterium]|nr:hypothetical protein [Pseudomonadota bacterium]MEE3100798.1 hypothetical protein [Pseudomonadota bacterium]